MEKIYNINTMDEEDRASKRVLNRLPPPASQYIITSHCQIVDYSIKTMRGI